MSIDLDLLKNIVGNAADIETDELTDDFDFVRSAHIDSLDWMEIVIDIEDEFDIELSHDDDAMGKCRTFGDLRKHVEALVEAKGK